MSTILKALEQLDRNGGPPRPPPVEGFEGIDPGVPMPAMRRRSRRPVWLGVGLAVAVVSLLLLLVAPGSDTPASAPPATSVAAVVPPAPRRVEVAQRVEPTPVERRVEEASAAPVPTPPSQASASQTTGSARAAAVIEPVSPAPDIEVASPAPVVVTAEAVLDEKPRASVASQQAAPEPAPAPEPERTEPAPAEPVLRQRATAGQLPPETIRLAWPEVVSPEPAREAEAIADAPVGGAPLEAPSLGLDSTSWHPSSERRSATLLVAGGAPRVVREGDMAQGYVVVEITPSSVLFAKGDQTVRMRVGER